MSVISSILLFNASSETQLSACEVSYSKMEALTLLFFNTHLVWYLELNTVLTKKIHFFKISIFVISFSNLREGVN